MTRALTIVARVDPHRQADLDAALTEIYENLAHNRLVPFARLATTHFARFVVLPSARRDDAPLLVFESNHDGEPEEYLDHLARVAGGGLDSVFGCCVGWPQRGVADVEGYGAFMRQHRRPAAAFHMGYRNYTKASVLNDLAVFAEIQRWLAIAEPERAALGERPARQLRERIARDVAAAAPQLSLAPAPAHHRLLILTLLSPLALVILPTYLVLALLLLRRERTDAVETADVPPLALDELHTLTAREDRRGVVQNQLTHLATIKGGRLRAVTLRFVLFSIALLARFYFNQGALGGITSIHFARWVILDDGRLLFLSNYDGSWESYLGDFIDRAHSGLTAVWSNTEGFPRSHWILGQGARDEEAFKRWTRRRQFPTQVWYSSYPQFSIDNVRNAIAVREGLCAHLGEEESRAWLARL